MHIVGLNGIPYEWPALPRRMREIPLGAHFAYEKGVRSPYQVTGRAWKNEVPIVCTVSGYEYEGRAAWGVWWLNEYGPRRLKDAVLP